MKRWSCLILALFVIGFLPFRTAAVPPPDGKQPVELYLYARITDHINLDFTEDRLRRILPMIEAYRKQHPEAHVTATLLFSGAVSQALADRNAETGIKDYVVGFIQRGVVQAGYDGTDEPTYDHRPMVDVSDTRTAEARWRARSATAKEFLTEARDPLTGKPQPGAVGGLQKMEEVFGRAVCITGVTLAVPDPFFKSVDLGGDSEVLQQLMGMNSVAMMFGVPDRSPVKLVDFRKWAADFTGTLSPSLETSPELYWQDNVLRSSESSDSVVHLVQATDGPDALKAIVDKLDRSKVRVLHIELAPEKIYVKPTPQSRAEFEHGPLPPPFTPIKQAYVMPNDPTWPKWARASAADVEAAYAKQDALLKWAVADFLPANPGSLVVGSKELVQMTEPSTGFSVSVSGLQAALGAYNKAWTGDTVPAPYLRVDGHYLSLADMFQVMIDALAGMSRTGSLPKELRVARVWGPMDMPQDSGTAGPEVTVESLEHACVAIAAQLHNDSATPIPSDFIPSHITIEGHDVNSAQFLHLMAEALSNPAAGAKITIKPASMVWGPPAVSIRNRPLSDMGATWTMKPAQFETSPAPKARS